MSSDYGIPFHKSRVSKLSEQSRLSKFSMQPRAGGRENLLIPNYSKDRLTYRPKESDSGDGHTQGSKISFSDKYNYYKDFLSDFKDRKNRSVSASRNTQSYRPGTNVIVKDYLRCSVLY